MNDHQLDTYLSEPVRRQVEEAYYARISRQAQLEHLVDDAYFWETLPTHPAIFADHGVVHVRDVAHQVLQVLRKINGVLIPPRAPEHLASFMSGYGVLLAYLHDIGMVDVSEFGRAMHPHYAAQAVFTTELDAIVAGMWETCTPALRDRLNLLASERVSLRPPLLLFRELLSLSIGHSKSSVSIKLLNDPPALRQHMLYVLSHSLEYMYLQQQLTRGQPHTRQGLPEAAPPFLGRFYSDFSVEAFDWLVSSHPLAEELVGDVVDTLRALRCADALRQRGSVQKTSAGYQVFLSRQTGYPTFALRLGDDRLFLLELPNPLSAGEANISSSEFTPTGDLRISFHRGAFASDQALHRAVSSTAFTINDFLVDIVESFQRMPDSASACQKVSGQIQVLLESTDDNPRFVENLQEQLRQTNLALRDQVHIVPTLQEVSDLERDRYLEASDLDWDDRQKTVALRNIQHSGQKIDDLHFQEAFEHVRLVHLQTDETLLEADTPSAFVYIPLSGGLEGCPLGGYETFSVPAWMPLGNTGVIRGASRNADVVARIPVSLLAIPKDVYLRHWYTPYTPEELRMLLEVKESE